MSARLEMWRKFTSKAENMSRFGEYINDPVLSTTVKCVDRHNVTIWICENKALAI